METQNSSQHSPAQKISFKLLVIFGLIIFLQIPLFLVKDVIRDRQSMQLQAQETISQRWGSQQYIGAPVLIVQKKPSTNNDVSQFESTLSASSANYMIELIAEKRYLGLFEAAIYSATIDITGRFDTSNLLPQQILSSLFIPFQDVNAIKSIDSISINNVDLTIRPLGKNFDDLNGFTIDFNNLNLPQVFNYHIKLQVSGSRSFSIVTNAKKSDVTINSNWHAPSFIGSYLPETRQITPKGFSAKWKINQIDFGSSSEAVSDSGHFIYQTAVKKLGVEIIIPANTYQVNTRTAKYSMLIILLSFAGLFLSEVFFKIRLHPFQYLLIGVSLSLFYLLLLSLSEHMRFNLSFLLSAFSTIVLVAGYCSVILGQRMRGIYTGVLFSVLYGFIFVLVKAEESSLLMGSIGLWIVLALVMYLTRKINWYESNSINPPKS